MNAIASIVERHRVVAFFVLAYALSWGSFLMLSGPFLFAFGPLVAALLVAGVARGRDGLRDLLSRCMRWRVGPGWYAAALLLPVGVVPAAVSLNVLLGAPVPTATQPAGRTLTPRYPGRILASYPRPPGAGDAQARAAGPYNPPRSAVRNRRGALPTWSEGTAPRVAAGRRRRRSGPSRPR